MKCYKWLHMRLRLKYALPILQMALAAIFLRLSFLWDVAARGNDSPGKHPAFILLACLNLPVALFLRPILDLPLPALWDNAMYAAGIGIFWYWVARRVQRYKERRTLFLFAWAPLRVTIDLFLIGIGAFLLWSLIENARSYPHNGRLSPDNLGWWWFIPTLACLLFWMLGLIVVFGTDLTQCLRGMFSRATAKANAVE